MADPIIGGSDTLWAEPLIEVCVTDIVLKSPFYFYFHFEILRCLLIILLTQCLRVLLV